MTLLQVLDELSQPALGGGVVLQDLGEGGVLQLVRKALPESFTCPTSRDKKRGPTNKLTGARGEQTPLGTQCFFCLGVSLAGPAKESTEQQHGPHPSWEIPLSKALCPDTLRSRAAPCQRRQAQQTRTRQLWAAEEVQSMKFSVKSV